MPEHIDQPCKDGLTAACFAQEPVFARRAFAFRLLSAFVPPAMSRKLLTFLGLIRFDPAGNLPDWLNLPPWWILLPGTIIPPGWKIGDPIFEGAFIPPYFFKDSDWQYPVGPDYLSPGGPGSPGKSKTSPSLVDPWFYDAFSSLDASIWSSWLDGTSLVSSDGSGNIWMRSSGSETCTFHTEPDATLPDKWSATFRMKVDSYSGVNPYFLFNIYSGSHNVRIKFIPPNIISHPLGGAETEVTVPNYHGTFRVFSLVYEDGYTNLYVDGNLLDSEAHHAHYSTGRGRFNFDNYGEMSTRLDYILIAER